jgi:chloramphenicol-sensitive protein RarD
MTRSQYITIFIAFLAIFYQFIAIGSIPYNEEFNFDKLVTFSLIWIALIIFSLDSFSNRNRSLKV